MATTERLPWRVEGRLARALGVPADLEICPHAPGALPSVRCVLPRAVERKVSLTVRVHSRAGIPLAHASVDKDIYAARDLSVSLLRQLITIKLREGNVINEHYKFVDGTSFAAPIVSSIAACMLEANPKLKPQQVKRILIDTAERVEGVEVDRQGWGVVVPRKAVEMALRCRG